MENTVITGQQIETIEQAAEKFTENVARVIIGKRLTVEFILVAMLSEGHILIEDVPGIGKTMLARASAKSLGCTFKRIQCTPDLLPSDVTGINYFSQKTGEFEFRPGPIMANIVLVDEINRATPRTQSCLLEAMQEKQVTVDLDTVPLPRPFLIMATQNPIELQGTFPLPEAQLDRFLLRIKMGYPDEKEEQDILLRFQQTTPLDNLETVIEAKELLEMQKICRQIHVSEAIRGYIVAITHATRNHKDIELGASPRASLGLHAASQALAAIRGRTFVLPDDIKYLAVPILSHRLTAKTGVRLKGHSMQNTVAEIIGSIPVPVED